jgi:hypothetical protein
MSDTTIRLIGALVAVAAAAVAVLVVALLLRSTFG